MAMKLISQVSRGVNKGVELTPHRHKDGMYVASMTRFKKDYVRVASIDELAILLSQGFRIRMSAQGIAPSLIAPKSIRASTDQVPCR